VTTEQVERDDDGVPPPTEEIHLPDPSYLPAVLALGITIAIVGVIMNIVIVIIGVILAVVPLVMWVRKTRAEMAELPLDH
jgi:hypothetical protein